jgi:single-strand DNA-binding protein
LKRKSSVRYCRLSHVPFYRSICTFGVATNRVYVDSEGKRQEEVTYHNVVAFGKTAEHVAQYMKKGRLIFVRGALRNRSWEKDGQKHTRTEIVAERIQFGPKGGKEEPEHVTELVDDPPEEAAGVEPTVVL